MDQLRISLPEIYRLDIKAPPTLLELAMHSLLRDEALAISALETLPRELFPSLFKEALTSGHNHTVRAMVAAWPFTCLPVGSLMKTLEVKTLQAVLSGIDLLLTQKVGPRRWKLQVVELRNVDYNFWDIRALHQDLGCSTQVPPRNLEKQQSPVCGEKQFLKVVADFHLESHHLDEYHTLLLQWAQLRKGTVQLCCRKLQVWTPTISNVLEMLKVCDPDTIQEFELNSQWEVETLNDLAPYLGQMRYLDRLLVSGIYKETCCFAHEEVKKKCVFQFISQFSKLQSLQHLHMKGVYFLKDHLKQLLRCLKTPLKTLCIMGRLLSQEDIDCLSHCQVLWQLTHLNLSGVLLGHLCTMPLQVLLERVTSTLQSLILQDCRMENSQLSALLPALRRCTQLTEVNFYGNKFSMPVLKNLLCHTAPLRHLTLELYPAPLEIYEERGDVIPQRFAQLCSHLMDTLCAQRQPKNVYFATEVCWECHNRSVYSLGNTLLHCWQFE